MANLNKEDSVSADEQAIAAIGVHVKKHLGLMRATFPSCHGYFDIRVQLVDGKVKWSGVMASYNTEQLSGK